MSNGDPTKWSHFERMNVVQFLNMVTYYKDKQEEAEQRRKIQEAKRR